MSIRVHQPELYTKNRTPLLVDVNFLEIERKIEWPKVIYMDSITKNGYILDNFRLAMFMTILFSQNLTTYRYSDIEQKVCK